MKNASVDAVVHAMPDTDARVDHDASVLFIRFTGSNGDDVKVISKSLQTAIDRVTREFLSDALHEVAVIEHELSSEMRGTERATTNRLNAKRLIYLIQDQDKRVMTLAGPDLSVESPKSGRTLVLFSVLGGLAGVFLIFIGHGFRRYEAGKPE